MTAAAFLLGLSALRGSYIDPNFPAPFYPIALWTSICAFLVVCGAWALEHFGYWVERDVTEEFRPAKRDELQGVLPFYDRVVGGDRPSVNELKDVFNANNQVFRFLEKVTKQGTRKKTDIVGFCTIVPLVKEAEPLLEREELNGLRMNRSHISPPRRFSRTIYIGSIGGEGQRAKAAVLNYVLGLIDNCASRGVQRVYTRPVTRDGLRVAKKYGFRPVKDDAGPDELRRLYYLDLTSRFERINSRRPIQKKKGPSAISP